MLAETMAGILAGKLDPRVGSTVAYIAAAFLRACEMEPPPPVQDHPYIPLIYRSLTQKDGIAIPQDDDVLDLNTGKACGRLGLHGEVLPLAPPTVETENVPTKREYEVEILDL